MLQTSSTYISDGAKGPDGGSSELVLLSCHVLHQAARENHRNIHMKITDLYPTSFLSYFFSPPTWHNIIFILFPSSTWKCSQSAFVPYLKVHAICTCPLPQSARNLHLSSTSKCMQTTDLLVTMMTSLAILDMSLMPMYTRRRKMGCTTNRRTRHQKQDGVKPSELSL